MPVPLMTIAMRMHSAGIVAIASCRTKEAGTKSE